MGGISCHSLLHRLRGHSAPAQLAGISSFKASRCKGAAAGRLCLARLSAAGSPAGPAHLARRAVKGRIPAVVDFGVLDPDTPALVDLGGLLHPAVAVAPGADAGNGDAAGPGKRGQAGLSSRGGPKLKLATCLQARMPAGARSASRRTASHAEHARHTATRPGRAHLRSSRLTQRWHCSGWSPASWNLTPMKYTCLWGVCNEAERVALCWAWEAQWKQGLRDRR